MIYFYQKNISLHPHLLFPSLPLFPHFPLSLECIQIIFYYQMDFILFHAVFICSPLLHCDTKMFRKQGQEDEKKPSEFRIVIGNIRGPCFYFKVAIKSSTQIMSDNYHSWKLLSETVWSQFSSLILWNLFFCSNPFQRIPKIRLKVYSEKKYSNQ